MSISPADLAALKQRIRNDVESHEQEIKSLTQELAAVELLEKRVKQEMPSDQRLLDLPAEAVPSNISFAESVRRAVRLFKNEEFSVANVETMLIAQKAKLPPRNVRTRIALEIKDLNRKGTIFLVHKGAGHTPHKYRLSPTAEEPEKSERPPLIPRRGLSVQH
jgi:hypothetical protein